ncbi:putative selenium delivery protein YdfZ [Celerinatantimonas sp. YJH-8]|uniref:putative selenium delivery protein YdfZ n=1 Tax=Celerinatantimonas sp. YJH-8 TaxID=3228714 RepID=UPI0038C56FDA
MTQVYDRNHNILTVGQRVLISENGETTQVSKINAEHLSAFDAQHNACIQLSNGNSIAPIDLARLG